jgi:acyl-CoA synthetase (AMP-forming)/AMP-acid ligase II
MADELLLFGAGAVVLMSTLRRTSHDVCLNAMPLFHIHGQIVNLLGSLVVGAAVRTAPAAHEWFCAGCHPLGALLQRWTDCNCHCLLFVGGLRPAVRATGLPALHRGAASQLVFCGADDPPGFGRGC